MITIKETPSKRKQEYLASLIGKKLDRVGLDKDRGLRGLYLGRVILNIEGRMIAIDRADKEYDSYLYGDPDEVYGFYVGEISSENDILGKNTLRPEGYSYREIGESIEDIILIEDDGERIKGDDVTHEFSVLVGFFIKTDKHSFYIYGAQPGDFFIEVRDEEHSPLTRKDLKKEWDGFALDGVSMKAARYSKSLKTGERKLIREVSFLPDE